MIDKTDLLKGKQGEVFFKNIAVRFLFNDELKAQNPDTGEFFSITDLRELKQEGEFALPDGTLIEVKSDFKCHITKNIIVEIACNGGAGWFQNCQATGVQYLIYFLFTDISDQYPYRTVMFDFNQFTAYINGLMSSEQYMRRHSKTKPDKDGTPFVILYTNLEAAIRHCSPIVADTLACEQNVIPALLESINRVFAQYDMRVDNASNLDECIIQHAHEG